MVSSKNSTTEAPENGKQGEVQTPETNERSDNGREAVKKDISTLDAEFAKMEREYNEMLAEKQERNAELARKLKSLKEGPDEFLKSYDAPQYDAGQLVKYHPDELKRMVTEHMERQLEAKPPKRKLHLEYRKNKYVSSVVEYVLESQKKAQVSPHGWVSVHPAAAHGKDLIDMSNVLGLVPFVRVEVR